MATVCFVCRDKNCLWRADPLTERNRVKRVCCCPPARTATKILARFRRHLGLGGLGVTVRHRASQHPKIETGHGWRPTIPSSAPPTAYEVPQRPPAWIHCPFPSQSSAKRMLATR
jgi:hypothetical protein